MPVPGNQEAIRTTGGADKRFSVFARRRVHRRLDSGEALDSDAFSAQQSVPLTAGGSVRTLPSPAFPQAPDMSPLTNKPFCLFSRCPDARICEQNNGTFHG